MIWIQQRNFDKGRIYSYHIWSNHCCTELFVPLRQFWNEMVLIILWDFLTDEKSRGTWFQCFNVSMFPNIDNKLGLTAVRKALNAREDKFPSTTCILEAVKICLKSNHSVFKENFEGRRWKLWQWSERTLTWNELKVYVRQKCY